MGQHMTGLSYFLAGSVATLLFLFLILHLNSFRVRRKPGRPQKLLVTFGPEGKVVMSLKMNNDSDGTTARLSAVDAHGKAVPLHSTPAWAVDDATLLVLTPAGDGLSCFLKPLGKDGTANVTVTGEGDPTPGVDALTISFPVELVDAEATQLTVSFDTPPP